LYVRDAVIVNGLPIDRFPVCGAFIIAECVEQGFSEGVGCRTEGVLSCWVALVLATVSFGGFAVSRPRLVTVRPFSVRATAIFKAKCPAVGCAGVFFARRVRLVSFSLVLGRFGGLRVLWGVRCPGPLSR
jgi:hypothetical protein